MMQARSKLKPGQKGTRNLVELSGARLVCVRYRDDEPLQKRFNTVELIAEEAPWTPKPAKPVAFKPEKIVGLKIACGEVKPGRNVKAACGKWNSTRRLWEIRYDQVAVLVWKSESKKHPILQTGLHQTEIKKHPILETEKFLIVDVWFVIVETSI